MKKLEPKIEEVEEPNLIKTEDDGKNTGTNTVRETPKRPAKRSNPGSVGQAKKNQGRKKAVPTTQRKGTGKKGS